MNPVTRKDFGGRGVTTGHQKWQGPSRKKNFFNRTSCWVRCAVKQNWYTFLDNIPGHSRQQTDSWEKRNTVNMGGPGVSKQNYSRVSKRQT